MPKRLTPRQQLARIRTEPKLPGAQDVQAMSNRQIVLDELYHLAGRDNPEHGLHGVYTGLWEELPFTFP